MVPVPPVDVPDGVVRAGEWLRFTIETYEGNYRHLPPELYLRQARDLDLTDLDAVTEFVANHGRVAPTSPPYRDLPGQQSETALARFAARRGRQYDGSEAVRGAGVLSCHVDEVIYRLTVLRSLTDHFIAYREGNYEREAWRAMEKPPESDEEAWRLFVLYANAALRAFHVRLEVDLADPDLDLGVARPNVYEAAVLQLANDLAEEVDLLRCHHCLRPFVRQVGRSRVQSRLEGVKYCTPECGRAASVKAYRARKRAERSKGT